MRSAFVFLMALAALPSRAAPPIAPTAGTAAYPGAVLLAPTVAASAAPAPRAERPLVGPVPAWVLPAPIPAPRKDSDGVAVTALLADQQWRLSDAGDARFAETALRIGSSQGLQAGSLALAWDPALDTLTIHRYRIVREGKVIDLLGDGSKLTVVRRETNLERATLDGELTATFQPEDVRVGDTIDTAYTVVHRDPALAGRSQVVVGIAPGVSFGRVRTRILWPEGKAVRWRALPGILQPGEHRRGGERELVSDLLDATAPSPPKGAPLRFATINMVAASDMGSWSDLSRLMAPLYLKAAALSPTSPLRAEVARIAASSADPRARALAALTLVQQQVRYLLLAMDDGGYVPAAADLTWSRRFGDCKGKTVLLLALLRELGIEARPALVNTGAGDGLDARLPMAGAFDHVLIEARIAGKIYWLDGTRPGDRALDQIRAPLFKWALPVSAGGADLVPIAPDPLRGPDIVRTLDLDARQGLDVAARATGEHRFEGDAAMLFRFGLAQLPPAERDRKLKEYWHETYDFVTATSVAVVDETATGALRLTMTGTAKMDWETNGGRRYYWLDGSRLGSKIDIAREPGPASDAPFAVNYPAWREERQTLLLPNGGKGFTLDGADVDRTIAALAFHRAVKLDGAKLTMIATTRATAPEIAFREAETAKAALATLAERGVSVDAPNNYQRTNEEVAALKATVPKDEAAFLDRGNTLLDRGDWNGALRDAEAAIALKPDSARAHGLRALALAWKGDARFEAAAARAEALDPKIVQPWHARAIVARKAGRSADLDADYTRAIALWPKDVWAIAGRADARMRAGRTADALADLDQALSIAGDQLQLQGARIELLQRLGRMDEAARGAQAFVAAHPDEEGARYQLAWIKLRTGDKPGALAEYDAMIARKPSASRLLERAQLRAPEDRARWAADLDAAARLEPQMSAIATARAEMELRAGNYAAAEAALARAEKMTPPDRSIPNVRLRLLQKQGRKADALALLQSLGKGKQLGARDYNSRCWTKATMNLDLRSALADCNEALRLDPTSPAALDSRGFTRLRLADYDGAIDDLNAALKLRPTQAGSLYARGIAKARKGLDGTADLRAARQASPGVDVEYLSYGVAAADAPKAIGAMTKTRVPQTPTERPNAPQAATRSSGSPIVEPPTPRPTTPVTAPAATLRPAAAPSM